MSAVPWSSKGSKGTIVDADQFMILDSEDLAPATTNKRITFDVLQLGIEKLATQIQPLDMGTNNLIGVGSIHSQNTPIATGGFLRMGNNESIEWRNFAGDSNGSLKFDNSNVFDYNIGGTKEYTFGADEADFLGNSLLNAPHDHSDAAGGGQLLSTAALSDTGDIAYLNTANIYTAGTKQSFVADATSAAINLNAFIPSSLVAGDIFRSAEIMRFTGTSLTDYILVSDGQPTSYTAGTRQDFLGDTAGTAGLNVGSIAGNPTTQVDGDLWLDNSTDQLFARINSTDIALNPTTIEMVVQRSADYTRVNILRPFVTPTKLSNPSTIPTGTSRSVSYSPSGRFMVVGHFTSPFVTIYERNGATFTALNGELVGVNVSIGGTLYTDSEPLTITGQTSGANNAVATANVTAGVITSVNITNGRSDYLDGESLTLLGQTSGANNAVATASATPIAISASDLPTGTGEGVAWSPDEQFMAVAYDTSPFINIYEISGTIFTKLPDPVDLPAGTGDSVSFSPNKQFLIIGHVTLPHITIYSIDGTTFTKIPDPATPPTALATGVAFSPNEQFLAVAQSNAPNMALYQITSNIFTKISNPATLPAGTGRSVAWSPDEQFLAVGHDNSPFVTIYQRDGATFTKLDDPDTLPTGSGRSVAWSPNGQFLAIGEDTTPFVTIYERDGTTFTKIADPATLPTGIGDGVSWSPTAEFLTVAHNVTPFVTTYQSQGIIPENGTLTFTSIDSTGPSVGKSTLKLELSDDKLREDNCSKIGTLDFIKKKLRLGK